MKNVSIEKERLWEKIENSIPGLKEELESQILMLKLIDYNKAHLDITFGKDANNQQLIRCHIYKDDCHKVFTIYINIKSNELFIRNEITDCGFLNTSSKKISIQSLDELKTLIKIQK